MAFKISVIIFEFGFSWLQTIMQTLADMQFEMVMT